MKLGASPSLISFGEGIITNLKAIFLREIGQQQAAITIDALPSFDNVLPISTRFGLTLKSQYQ